MATAAGYFASAQSKMLKSIHQNKNSISFTEAKKLQDILNTLLQSSNFDDQTVQTLWSKVSNNKHWEVSTSLKVSTTDLKQAWSDYYSLLDKYNKEMEKSDQELTNQIQTLEQLKTLKSKALGLQGRVSKLQGDLFEAFLQVVLGEAKHNLDEMIELNEEQLIDEFKKGLNSVKDIKIITEGATTLKRASGHATQVKTDVVANLPQGVQLNLSAKNYGKLRDITMVGKARVGNLLAEWPRGSGRNKAIDEAYSSLSGTGQFNFEAQKLLAIQGITGTSQEELKSQVLVVNINSGGKQPIRVLPIYEFLIKALDVGDQIDFNKKYFKFITEKNEPISNSNLTIKLKKDNLKLMALKNYLTK